MPTPRKLARELEGTFTAAWANPLITAPQLAARFGMSRATVFATAKALDLPPRMPVLERLKLPPFGRRERAA